MSEPKDLHPETNEIKEEACEGTCKYAGTEYDPGSRVCQGGRMMECTAGTWTWTGEYC